MAEKIDVAPSSTTAVRWDIPDDVKEKIRRHKIKLMVLLDREVSQEEAAIHMMKIAKVPRSFSLEQ